MQSTFDALQQIVQEADGSQSCKASSIPLSDAPMVWGEYNLFREFNPSIAFCAFMASQLKSSRFTDSVTQQKLGQLRAFREDHDPVATQTMWSHIALWDNHQLGFPGRLRWTFRETDKVETYSKRFTMEQIRRIIDVSKKLNLDAAAVQKDLELNDPESECASFLLSQTSGMPEHLTLWEAKVWCRHAQHQAEELREACEVILADRASRFDEYIASGVCMFRDGDPFDVLQYLDDYFLVSKDGNEIISL
jgi:hypothetical protein